MRRAVSLRSLMLAAPSPSLSGGPIPVAQLAPLPRGQLAALAQTSPLWSFFNRLDGFVHELHSTRGFFAHWPERICDHMGAVPVGASSGLVVSGSNSAADGHGHGHGQQDLYQDSAIQNGSASILAPTCWNGRDFAPYKANLVQFGQIGTGNPEVQRPNEPYNALILNIIARLKDVGSQLSRKNTRSPAASIYHEGTMGKYGHSSSLHHKNHGLISEHEFNNNRQSGIKNNHNHNRQQALPINSAVTSDETNTESAVDGVGSPDQERGSHSGEMFDSATSSQTDQTGLMSGEQQADDNNNNNNNESGLNRDDEDEDVADDVEGSGDYYTDDYPDDEQEDVACEGDDCQKQGPDGLVLNSPTQDNTNNKFSSWDESQQSTSDMDNNGQIQKPTNNFDGQQPSGNNGRWQEMAGHGFGRSDNIDRHHLTFDQDGLTIANPTRYIDAIGHNKQVGSSASFNHGCSASLFYLVMATSLATSYFSLAITLAPKITANL